MPGPTPTYMLCERREPIFVASLRKTAEIHGDTSTVCGWKGSVILSSGAASQDQDAASRGSAFRGTFRDSLEFDASLGSDHGVYA